MKKKTRTKAWFDAKDIVTERLNGKTFIRKNVLHFHLITDNGDGPVYAFSGPAEERHKKGYDLELKAFLGKNKIETVFDQVIEAETVEEISKENTNGLE